VDFNVQNNPFQGAYLFHFNMPQRQQSTSSDADSNHPFKGGMLESQSFLSAAQYQRDNEARRKKNGGLSSENLQRMLSQISQQQNDINRLKYQIEASKDPFLKTRLQSTLGEKSNNFFSLQNTVSQQFKNLSSGFLGSENKTDHVGSFVTFT
jgi:hypothetical protein